MKKTWLEKIKDKANFPKIVILKERFPCYNAVHKMGANAGDPVVLVNASEIIPLMAEVPNGIGFAEVEHLLDLIFRVKNLLLRDCFVYIYGHQLLC